MASPRPSNVDRAKWRTKCREILSQHIQNQLGISIDPSEVRLITNEEDPYSWKYLPTRAHLFQKSLSKHSIGAYMELCREVDISFEAVAGKHTLFAKTKENFTTRIAELEAENSTLKSEGNRWKEAATAEAQQKREAEEAINELRLLLHTANLENQHLQYEIQKQNSIADALRKNVVDSRHIVNEASSILERLKSSLPGVDNLAC
ncbi:hypothetical protein BDZ45DRAFT_804288 [Acephala macrosclerotiorum]|nr:hypothetical protein BDZ45DRAFT_804288 [Acephala macrosclerotiorum]